MHDIGRVAIGVGRLAAASSFLRRCAGGAGRYRAAPALGHAGPAGDLAASEQHAAGAVGDKAVRAPAEAGAYLAERHAAINRYLALDLNADWPSLGDLTDRRTSLIVSPSTGRLPPRTPPASAGRTPSAAGCGPGVPTDPRTGSISSGCVLGRSVPFVAPSWDERLQIFQTPDHVALEDEMGELRLVPLRQGAPLSRAIRQ